MFSRRAFLIGAGTALTLPVVKKFQWFIEQHDRPLIEVPENPIETLYVYRDFDYQIDLGAYVDELPSITWRQFLTDYQGEEIPTKLSEFRDLYENWGIRPRDLDTECPSDRWVDSWARSDSPNARAYDLLSGLDLGPELTGGPCQIGGIEFIDGASPGNDYLGVQAKDELSVSLLQHRLNELGQRYEVELLDSW